MNQTHNTDVCILVHMVTNYKITGKMSVKIERMNKVGILVIGVYLTKTRITWEKEHDLKNCLFQVYI